MNHTSKPGMILGLLLICCSGFLYASDADEFRQRAKALRKEASELAERKRTGTLGGFSSGGAGPGGLARELALH